MSTLMNGPQGGGCSPKVLILTATVTPVAPVKRNDPAVRYAEYKRAIQRWLTETAFTDLIVVESGMTPILNDELTHIALSKGKTVREVLLDLSECTRRYGKGRSEAKMLDRVVELLPPDCVFHKITGRLFVGNHDKALAQPDPVIFNTYELVGFNVDTRFWRATRSYYDSALRPLTKYIDDADSRTYIENVYPIERSVGWQCPLNIIGFSGTNDTPYH